MHVISKACLSRKQPLTLAGWRTAAPLLLAPTLVLFSVAAQATAAKAEPEPQAPVLQQPVGLMRLPASAAAASSPLTRTGPISSVLNLPHLLAQATRAHPSIQAARLDARASAEDMQAVERQRWPTLSAIVENKSTNTNVVSTRVLRLEQNLWDGGRLSARIREAETNVAVNEARIYIQNQTLSLQIVNAWQNLLSADGRILVATDILQQLAQYRQQMERRVKVDASPPIDLELVQSRILQTEVELTQARNARRVSLSKLEQYSGIEGLTTMAHQPTWAPGFEQTAALVLQLEQTAWLDVASRHPDVHKARQDALVAQERIQAKRAEQWPQVYLRLDQPVGAADNSLTAFVGLRYTPGAGLSTAMEAQALSSRAASQEQAVDSAMRGVLEALYTDRDELSTSRIRMQALDKAVQGSRAVLESYGRQFTAGRKTWQDLMNAVRELGQNQYNLVDTHAAMVSAMYRLQIRTGQSPSPAQ